MVKSVAWIPVLIVIAIVVANAVDRSKFRSCKDTGFCRVFRSKAGPIYGDHYRVDAESIVNSPGKVSAQVIPPSNSGSDNTAALSLQILFYRSGSVRVKLSEHTPRWQPNDLLFDDGSKLTDYRVLSDTQEDLALLPTELRTSSGFHAFSFGSFSTSTASGNNGNNNLLVVHSSPLKVDLYSDGVLLVSMNERALLHFEQSVGSAKDVEHGSGNTASDLAADRHAGKKIVDYGEDGLAIYADGSKEEKDEGQDAAENAAAQHHEEHIKGDNFGGHRDTMPRGPRSVGVDIAFPFARHVYGIPEHSVPLALPTTQVGTPSSPTGSDKSEFYEPYRLYNLDVFEYEIHETMALYGNIPLLLAHNKIATTATANPVTAGVFWFNPSETFVDISDAERNTVNGNDVYKQSRWLSESGEVDLFLLPGPTIRDVYRQYGALTGTQQLPPLFALGYHQCRWNYRDERDVATVESMFEQLDYPVDVIWLDIEHTDGKRYFTWDKHHFPTPEEMQRNISSHGRKMVTIVDPHIKRDDHYAVHKDATSKDLYVKNKDGGIFDGWCWPGSSSYLDFTSPVVRQWWADQFALNKYVGSTLDLFTWNDMNEPSVFNGPEVSMPKDARSLEGEEHREWHNLYGIYMQMATAVGLQQRSPSPMPQQRPFVLTRSFWAGSQRWGAMWTGDNTADWSHLQIAAPMLLSINLGGLSFAGADVGGFFGEPDAELFVRWYQAGAFTPFFRGHAHIDTKRREPWVFGEPSTSILRSAALQRYSLLPLWYTVFYEAYTTGMPVMRPMFFEFPGDETTYGMDAQWMVGNSLLVSPVTHPGHTSVQVYLPPTSATGTVEVTMDPWFELETLNAIPPSARGQFTQVAAPLDKIPVFIRPGAIVTRKMRLRRSSKLMYYDPYTLVVAPAPEASVAAAAATTTTTTKTTGTADHLLARGSLYLDDEHSLAHEVAGAFALRTFEMHATDASMSVFRITCRSGTIADLGPGATSVPVHSDSITSPTPVAGAHAKTTKYSAPNAVERIVLAGQGRSPVSVRLLQHGEEDEKILSFVYDPDRKVVTIKKPDVAVMEDWSVTIQY